MAKPQTSKSGCFSGFLQALLCAGNKTSPPLHSSDHVAEPEKPELMQIVALNKDTMVDEYAAATTPGVIARLMGLDSLPNTKFLTKGSTPDSVPRSRSVNFVDYLLEFDLNQASKHRRMKTSASFREVPALGRRQNHDLVVLYWGDDDESRGEEAMLKKAEKGVREFKQKKKQGSENTEILKEKASNVKKEWNQGKNKKISKLKNEPRRVPSSSSSSSSSSSCKQSRMVRKHHCEVKGLSNVSSSTKPPLPNKKKKGFVEPKLPVNKRNQKSHKKKIETGNNSENLSPVSVLDTNDYPFLHENNFIDNSRSTSPLASRSKLKSSSVVSLDDDDGVEDSVYTDLNKEAEYYSELLMKLHTLTEKDIRESNITSNHEGFEEICLLFEHKILDHLLHEFVNEVLGISS